jgi:hypothetical protein
VNFNFGTAEYDMLVLFIDVVGFCKTLQLLGCLLMDFILDSGKIHGDITAVSKAEGLYNVDEMQFCAVVAGDGPRPPCDLGGILAEVDGNQDFSIFGHISSPRISVYTLTFIA